MGSGDVMGCYFSNPLAMWKIWPVVRLQMTKFFEINVGIGVTLIKSPLVLYRNGSCLYIQRTS